MNKADLLLFFPTASYLCFLAPTSVAILPLGFGYLITVSKLPSECKVPVGRHCVCFDHPPTPLHFSLNG